ncbi:hypothetical protein AGLY_002585 [Aphis glycines]|uniref:Uncharacterized protein n=1 Tax=Aphis glycines TaxID=307491 RepID=A0A6G0U0T2_APHGL|nr:hypothetical protein AGLY_002585 [Aphis glycines]
MSSKYLYTKGKSRKYISNKIYIKKQVSDAITTFQVFKLNAVILNIGCVIKRLHKRMKGVSMTATLQWTLHIPIRLTLEQFFFYIGELAQNKTIKFVIQKFESYDRIPYNVFEYVRIVPGEFESNERLNLISVVLNTAQQTGVWLHPTRNLILTYVRNKVSNYNVACIASAAYTRGGIIRCFYPTSLSFTRLRTIYDLFRPQVWFFYLPLKHLTNTITNGVGGFYETPPFSNFKFLCTPLNHEKKVKMTIETLRLKNILGKHVSNIFTCLNH